MKSRNLYAKAVDREVLNLYAYALREQEEDSGTVSSLWVGGGADSYLTRNNNHGEEPAQSSLP